MKKEEIIKDIKKILEEYNIKRASLFGSFARGEERDDSDIDLLIDFPEGSTLLDMAGIYQDIKDKLGREVDIVTYRSIKPNLKEYIESEKEEII